MELEPMKEQIKSNIENLSKKSADAESPDVAMKYAQAALNLAHALATLKGAGQLS